MSDLSDELIRELGEVKPEWRPIETAPMDGTKVMLFIPGQHHGVTIGKWNEDKYSKKPRPYWTTDLELLWGKLTVRSNQPTHWMLLPAPPEK